MAAAAPINIEPEKRLLRSQRDSKQHLLAGVVTGIVLLALIGLFVAAAENVRWDIPDEIASEIESYAVNIAVPALAAGILVTSLKYKERKNAKELLASIEAGERPPKKFDKIWGFEQKAFSFAAGAAVALTLTFASLFFTNPEYVENLTKPLWNLSHNFICPMTLIISSTALAGIAYAGFYAARLLNGETNRLQERIIL